MCWFACNFDYQGNYSEEEEETGNDPVNNVDPDGGATGGWLRGVVEWISPLYKHTAQTVGQFTGTAQGTSLSGGSSAGSSGGGSAGGSIANGLGNAAAGALGQYVVNHLLPLPQGPDARQLQSCGSNNSASSGSQTSNQQSSAPSEKVVNSPGSDCKCPPGYSTTPKNPGDQAYFFDIEDVAKDWAYKASSFGMNGTIEYASQIFSINVPNGTSKTTLFGHTTLVRFPPNNDPKTDPSRKSPAPYRSLHGESPAGAKIVAHIHLHYEKSKGSDQFKLNRKFSPGDEEMFKNNPNLIYYLLGSFGDLYGRYPDVMPPLKGPGNFPDPKAGETERSIPGGQGFYKSGITRPEACRCYKQ